MLAKAVVASVLLQCGKQILFKFRLTLLHFSNVLKGIASKKVMELDDNKNASFWYRLQSFYMQYITSGQFSEKN